MKFKEGGEAEIQHTYLTEASVCYDAFYTPDGDSVATLEEEPDYIHFINEGFRHCKALAFAKGAEKLIADSYIAKQEKDAGVVVESKNNLTTDFITAMKGHRVWDREKVRKVPA